KLTNILSEHKPGDTLTLLVKGKEKKKDREVKVILVAEDGGGPVKGKGGKGGGGFGWDTRNNAWKKDTYRLAIVGIEFPDVKHIDGIFFLYAGERVQTNRGRLYWPHKAFFTHQGSRWPYFIVQEGGAKMCDISVICHEFGHMLGLPDLYARPENPGSEGVGVWCAMSNQVGGGKPQHFCAWSKEQLGWITPAILDPTVKQKLILSPIEDSPKQCF